MVDGGRYQRRAITEKNTPGLVIQSYFSNYFLYKEY